MPGLLLRRNEEVGSWSTSYEKPANAFWSISALVDADTERFGCSCVKASSKYLRKQPRGEHGVASVLKRWCEKQRTEDQKAMLYVVETEELALSFRATSNQRSGTMDEILRTGSRRHQYRVSQMGRDLASL